MGAGEIAAVGGVFLLAGAVKGVLGLGLPALSLGLLTLLFNLPTAITLVLIPALVTNVWQGIAGGQLLSLSRRLAWFFVAALPTIWVGTLVLSYSRVSSLLLGAVFVVYAVSSLIGARYAFIARHEKANGVLFGAINGVFTGMTGSFTFPGVIYLQCIGLPRDALVQAMGILFTLSTLILGLSVWGRGLLMTDLNTVSAAAVVPAVVGMMLGQRVRRLLPEARFRRVFFIGLIMLGGYIMLKSVLGGVV